MDCSSVHDSGSARGEKVHSTKSVVFPCCSAVGTGDRIAPITLIDGMCSALTCKGAGGTRFNLNKLRRSGIRQCDIPAHLLSVGDALARGGKEKFSPEVGNYVTHALYYLRSFIDCVADVEPLILSFPLENFLPVLDILSTLSEAEIIKTIKCWCIWPKARWLRDSGTESLVPKWIANRNFPLPFSGGLRRHLRNLVASRSESIRAARFTEVSLQGIKRGCAPVSVDFILGAMLDHKAALTKEVVADLGDDFYGKCWRVWAKPVNKVRGSYRMVRASWNWERETKNPSNHACFGVTRGGGGRLKVVREFITGRESGRVVEPVDPAPDVASELLGISVDEVTALLNTQPKTSRVDSTSPCLGPLDLGGMYQAGASREKSFFCDADIPYSDALREVHKLCLDRHLKTEVHVIEEPLKGRVISKGEGLPYWLSQTWQKKAKRILDRYAPFKLTTRPVQGSDLEFLRTQTDQLFKEFDHWVSGDYKAATDGLSLEANQECLRALLAAGGATSRERSILRKVLGAHWVNYPEPYYSQARLQGLDLEPFLMTNGQLMGSLLSFPVLCTINLVAYWRALERYSGREFTINELPVLINGDDICFRANTAFYQIWKEETARVGFTLSEGKNYFSRDYVTINSAGWIDKRDSSGHRRLISLPALNAGLLLRDAGGPFRPPARANQKEKPFADSLSDLLDSCHDPARTLRRFIHYSRTRIEEQTLGGLFNLFSHPTLGGIGVRCPEVLRDSVRFTEKQKLLAGYGLKQLQKLEGRTLESLKFGIKSGVERVRVIERDRGLLPRNVAYHPRLLVFRDVMEPMREHEESLKDCEYELFKLPKTYLLPELTNYNNYELIRPAKGVLKKAIAAGNKIHKPFDLFMEPRGRREIPRPAQTHAGPTDDASRPALQEIRAEMATE